MVIIIRCSVLFTHSHTLFIRCMCNTEGWHTHSSLEKYILCKEWWYYLSSFKSIADRTILKNILSFQQEIRQLVNGKLFSQGGKYTIAIWISIRERMIYIGSYCLNYIFNFYCCCRLPWIHNRSKKFVQWNFFNSYLEN